jgi:hypothetical protein
MIRCTVCGEDKLPEEFAPSRRGVGRTSGRCRTCDNGRARARYAAKVGRAVRRYGRSDEEAADEAATAAALRITVGALRERQRRRRRGR